ncbi:glycosyltransferase [Frateuria defendens]|uniref:glycosyltransferase n=1 Tax=Frateuria defendens TaxID=2219559 RepID=UPI000A922255|nr:glycosyltransferase [Frateuria defendens]
MKVWLLLSRLGHGGLERVQLNIAKAMHARGVDVSIVAGQILADVRHELPPALPVIELAKPGLPRFFVGLLRALYRDRPAVVFTTSNDVACLLLLLRLTLFQKMRVIVTQHLSLSGPRQIARGRKRIKLELIRTAMRLLLPGANGLVAVSRGVAEDMRRELSLKNAEITIIHNPIVTPDFDAHMQETSAWPWSNRDAPTIIFVGRLSTEKRLDLLLDSFLALIRTMPARLLIVGEGSARQEIERRIRIDGLQDCCKLTGFVHNALPLMHAADVLALPSDYEGFGNVLVEAMACGTQVVSTDCPHGPAEILNDGEFGQLIPMNDPAAFEAALRNSLEHRFHVAPAALKARASTFGQEAAVSRYIALLHRATAR